nr:transposase [Citrobacter farmeri]
MTGTYVLCRKWLTELDNNVAGNALRLVSLGRKNKLFFDSDHEGDQGTDG